MKVSFLFKNTVLLLLAFINSHATAQNVGTNKDSLLTNADTIRANPAAAVSLLSFAGSNSNGQSLLTWKTFSHSAFTHFTVERNLDTKQFLAMGDVSVSADNNSFTYVDQQPVVGRNYYRLKLTDSGGTVTYSVTIPVTNAPVSRLQIQYAAGSGSIVVSGLITGTTYQLKLYNSGGQLLLQKTVSAEQPATSIDNLPHGLYVVYATDGTIAPISRKIIW